MSGDYGKSKKAKGRGARSSSCGCAVFGRLANIDEVYPSFLAFGLIDADQKGKVGVNTHPSVLNRFLQSGGAAKVTRSAGTYGGALAPRVSFGLVGNAHPSLAFAMVDGSTGCQVAAAHDRLLFYTAPRVVPHEDVSESVKIRGPRYIWTDIPRELAELAGLGGLIEDPDKAAVSGASELQDAHPQNIPREAVLDVSNMGRYDPV